MVFIILFIFALFAIFKKPYFGIAITIATLPVIDVLPSIPFASSITSLLGAFTFLSYFWNRRFAYEKESSFPKEHLFSILFIIWIFISHPQEAFYDNNRNWIVTFIQLLILSWLAGQVLVTKKSHHTLFWIYSMACIISAFYAIQQGMLGGSFDSSVRVQGFAEGINDAARYFVIAIVFLYHLLLNERKELSIRNFFIRIGIGILIIGLVYTVSRTGILLLLTAFGFLLLNPQKFEKNNRLLALVSVIIGVIIFFIPFKVFSILVEQSYSSTIQGSDTMGLRYNLWSVAVRMWTDNFFSGVGIGQFRTNLYQYGFEIFGYNTRGVHNTYLQVLSETGIVGFAIFLSIIFMVLKNLFSIIRLRDKYNEIASLAYTWFIVFIIILIGGMTKTDLVHKFLWITFGIGFSFKNLIKSINNRNIGHNRNYDKFI